MNDEQKEIIRHTIRTNQPFCGDSPDMDDLVKQGLMSYLGRKGFVPDGYYQVTGKGREAIKSV